MIDAGGAREAFERNFERDLELGASLAIWRNGQELLNLGQGFCDRYRTHPWTAATPVLVWSATKGPAAACLLHLLENERLPLAMSVREFWPEMQTPLTFAQVLSHGAGLPALDEKTDALDHTAVAEALARQPSAWTPGEAHGYHPRTFGYLVDELVRRVGHGTTLSSYWRKHFATSMQLDFWIGAPGERLDDIAPVHAARLNEAATATAFSEAFRDRDSLTARAFASPAGLSGVAAMNAPAVRQHALPAFGGIGTAEALAKFYAMLAAGGQWEENAYFAPETLAFMETAMHDGPDRVLLMPTAFSAGFMKDPTDCYGNKSRRTFGPSPRAFGQPGAGGSLAFADPENGLGFAYVMNRMGTGVLPNARAAAIVNALYGIG